MKKVLVLAVTMLVLVWVAWAQQPSKSGKSDTGYAKDKTAASAQTSKAGTAGESAKKGGKLDINTATKEELEQLPGIGPATSQKIIDGRPYRAKNELVSKKIISKSEYDKIKEQIIAHQAKATKK